jgi:hypothetical protein
MSGRTDVWSSCATSRALRIQRVPACRPWSRLLDVVRARRRTRRALVITGEGSSSTGRPVELAKLDRAGMLLFLDRLQGLLATLYVFGRPVVGGERPRGGGRLPARAVRRLARPRARRGAHGD